VLWAGTGAALGGNYIQRRCEILAAHPPGEITAINIAHEASCPLLLQSGACDCNAAIAIVPRARSA
jgi:hypothetical protein